MTVTCILPTRDRPARVRAALASALAQTHPVQVIVVDDGTDGALALPAHPSVRLLHTGGAGVAAARNAALAVAEGTFVAFLDDDDAWHPDKIARQLKVMTRRSELALTFTDYTVSEPDSAPPLATRSFTGDPSLARLLEKNFIGTLTVMARREVLLAEGGFDAGLVRGSDYELWLRVRRRHAIARVPGVLADYRWHADSLTGASRRRNTQNYVDVIERLAARHPELFTEAGAVPAALLASARARLRQQT